MSSALTLARPYARAAFSLARALSRLPPWSASLGFAAQVALDSRVQSLLGHPALTADDAVALLSPPADAAGDEMFGNYLAVLADAGRLQLLPEIAALYEQQRAEAEHVVKATITSATVLDAAEVAKLHDALKKRFGSEVEIATAVDPELIGGAVIDAGDVVIDGSLRNKLARLESALAH
jgi:F-type H+-transporting ATPase subunit delta